MPWQGNGTLRFEAGLRTMSSGIRVTIAFAREEDSVSILRIL